MSFERQIPGGLGVDETGSAQRQIPGGIGVDETASGAVAYTLTCAVGAYSLAGLAATFSRARNLALATGPYVIAGQAATLAVHKNYALACADGTYQITGLAAILAWSGEAVAPTGVLGGGGWMPFGRRKTRKQVYAERVRLGILPEPVRIAAEHVAAKVIEEPDPLQAYKDSKDELNRTFLSELHTQKWIPDYTIAIRAAIAIMQQEEEDILLLI